MSSKAKYRPETDSAQVEWSKDEKHFEKRVKKYVKLLKGKRLWPDLGLVNHLGFSPVHFSSPGQHQFSPGDKGFGNVAPSGECYSPLRNTLAGTEVRASARMLA
jgi:hypothetical protein